MRKRYPGAIAKGAKLHGPTTLAIDIGGTGLKMVCLDAQGAQLARSATVATPRPATSRSILAALAAMAIDLSYDRVSCGFPGVVRDGVVHNAPNLDGPWSEVALAELLEATLGRPARVCNDADVQGYGAIDGLGVELTLTLGTGVGSALFVDGQLVPNLELGHHPFADGRTYEQALRKTEVDRIGDEAFNRRLRHALAQIECLFNYRQCYLGGGYASKVTGPLPCNVQCVDNAAGLIGGMALWRTG